MQCPVDGETLLLSERQGVEIDYCPSCRGVWLDRGELDKLVRHEDDEWREYERRPERPEREEEYQPHYGKRKKKKKGGFLSEVFDFE